nr:immunoglobulin light chain junction region [Macaca mulatta]MOW13072.1 immunoglobulin light chain junction region [Macaca mulatta]MOW13660.1 immunoglobulin light chain junction region [Macaca mulatta]MOW74640.1 immunoglobulin light chain junction region [Macaca mulatta]MOW74992.1 immunoglobulin light chain junction region [Macaca mulatta]
CMQALQLPYTF